MGEFILTEYIAKLMEPKALISIVAIFAIALVLLNISKVKFTNTKMITYGAVALAIAFVLSYLRLIRLPNSGTITLASMLPIFIYAYIAGPRAGITVGLCYGMLQAIQDWFFVHPAQFILDYPLAFAMLGLAGLFRKNIYLGAIVGVSGRFICHFLSGAIFFAEFANGQNVYLYSLLYNMSYLVPDFAICLVVLAIPFVKNTIMKVVKTA